MWVEGVLQRIHQAVKNITPLITIYISLLLFVVINRDYFVLNKCISQQKYQMKK